MKPVHDRVQELIPEFLNGSLSEAGLKDVEEHLKECPECSETVNLLRSIALSEVPDPGDLYWNTLPQKVKVSVREQERRRFGFSALFSPFRIGAAAAALILITVTSFVLFKNKPAAPDLIPSDPFSAAVVDYSAITADDIPLITEQLPIAELETYSPEPIDSSYYREFASLSARELESVYESLKEQNAGG